MTKVSKISLKNEMIKLIGVLGVYLVLLPLSYMAFDWAYPILCILTGVILSFQLLKVQTIIVMNKNKKQKVEFILWSIFAVILMTGIIFYYEIYIIGIKLPLNISLWLIVFNVAALYGIISIYVRDRKNRN